MAATARAHARPQRAAPTPRPGRPPAPRARRASRPRVAGGVVWIALVAVLLAGIVAVNVAALRLNVESQRLDERIDKARADKASAQSELSSLGASSRIEAVGRQSLGLVEAPEASYVRVRRPGR
jgi:cell division protein FtsL